MSHFIRENASHNFSRLNSCLFFLETSSQHLLNMNHFWMLDSAFWIQHARLESAAVHTSHIAHTSHFPVDLCFIIRSWLVFIVLALTAHNSDCAACLPRNLQLIWFYVILPQPPKRIIYSSCASGTNHESGRIVAATGSVRFDHYQYLHMRPFA